MTTSATEWTPLASELAAVRYRSALVDVGEWPGLVPLPRVGRPLVVAGGPTFVDSAPGATRAFSDCVVCGPGAVPGALVEGRSALRRAGIDPN